MAFGLLCTSYLFPDALDTTVLSCSPDVDIWLDHNQPVFPDVRVVQGPSGLGVGFRPRRRQTSATGYVVGLVLQHKKMRGEVASFVASTGLSARSSLLRPYVLTKRKAKK